MPIFSITFFKIISILLKVFVGFIAGRFANVERDSISSLLFYIIVPIVFFSVSLSTKMTSILVSIILISFSVSTLSCLFAIKIYSARWKDYTLNVLAMSAGSVNSGFFMIPIAAIIFDEEMLNMYMMTNIGISIYDSLVGYYICARSVISVRESIVRTLKLPILNAFLLGLFFNWLGVSIPGFLDNFISDMRDIFATLGMILIGLALSKVYKLELDLYFLGASIASKFIVYPAITYILIALDMLFFKVYNTQVYDCIKLIAFAPIGTSSIIFSSIWKLNPEKVATAVLASSVIALVYTPIMIDLCITNIKITSEIFFSFPF